MKINMLKGINIKPIKRLADEKGSFTEILRMDWQDLFAGEKISQANISVTYPGIVRAWHKHLRGQTDYLIALEGTMKICAFDEKTEELDEIISSGQDIQVVSMPGHYWHGFKALGNEPAMLLYFTTRLYDYATPDEERRPWNDPTIKPKSINGKTNDPRVGKTWDWNKPTP